MGQGTDRVKPEEIELEIEQIRNEMDPVLTELDHRRHQLMDWRHQIRRRLPALLKGAAAVAGAVLVIRMVRHRRRAA